MTNADDLLRRYHEAVGEMLRASARHVNATPGPEKEGRFLEWREATNEVIAVHLEASKRFGTGD